MKRWWGIRHVRYFFARSTRGRVLARYGAHSYVVFNIEEAIYLERIWRGEA